MKEVKELQPKINQDTDEQEGKVTEAWHSALFDFCTWLILHCMIACLLQKF